MYKYEAGNYDVIVVGAGHAGKAPNRIECKIDGVEFNMADGMNQAC